MKIYFFLFAWLAFAATTTLPDPTILQGKVTDDTGSPLIGATIKVFKDGNIVRGSMTDVDGKYRLVLDPGSYTVEVNYTGYEPFTQQKVSAVQGRTMQLDIKMTSAAALEEVVVVGYSTEQSAKKAKSADKGGGKRAPAPPSKTSTPASTGSVQYSTQPSPKAPRPAEYSRIMPVQTAGSTLLGRAKDNRKTGETGFKTAPDSLIEGNEEQYNTILENPYQDSRSNSNSISTFSIDVDAASYANLRRYINSGQLPPRDAVRIEEMVNYFDYTYPQPTRQHPFEVSTELAPCPWAPEHRLLMIGLQGQRMDLGQLPAANLVFLMDVSGSMGSADKLPLVQKSLELLTDQLRPNDRVAIVVYAGAAGTVLESTPGTEKLKIKEALNKLQAGGSTAGGEGIQLAYQVARKNFVPGGNNRVILCTDGDFNVGVSSEKELIKLIENERNSGVYLTVLGFGTGNYQDGKMQELADKGNGNHAYIDGLAEAKKVLVQEFGGTLFAIAKDVKLQVHFNPAQVAGYRLIGYENRMLATEDFNDDKKDAGELGAGHRVTALYELIPAGQLLPPMSRLDSSLVMVSKSDTSVSVGADDLLVLQLRYKKPKGEMPSQLMEYRLPATALGQAGTSENLLLASVVAEFGLLLRDSKYKGTANYAQALERARRAAKNDPNGYRSELADLIEKAGKIPPPTAGNRR